MDTLDTLDKYFQIITDSVSMDNFCQLDTTGHLDTLRNSYSAVRLVFGVPLAYKG